MSAFVRKAAIIVGAVALVATGVGAAAGAGLIGFSASLSATLGTGIIGSLGTVSSLAAAGAAGLGIIGQLTAKKPSQPGNPMAWQSDPQVGIPVILGRAYSGGKIVYRQTFDKDNVNQTINTVYSIGPVKGFETFYVDGVATTIAANGQAAVADRGKLYVATQLGQKPEASQLGGTNNPGITTSSKLSGLAADTITLSFDSKGKVTFTTEPQLGWVLGGPTVYDPRKDSTYPGGSGAQRAADETTWSYTGFDNPYLQAIAHLLGRRQNGKLVAGAGVPIETILLDQFVEGANIADANGWKMGGEMLTTDSKWKRLKDMLQAGGGEPMRLGAQIGCMVNTPRVSLATIGVSDVIGDASVQATQAMRDRINAVVPRFMAEQSLTTQNSDGTYRTAVTWGMVAAAPVVVSDYVTFDGRQRQTQIDFEYVQGTTNGANAPNQVAQLARYAIENAREFGPITLPLKLRWMGYRPGDVVTANLPELGLNGQDILLLNRSLDPSKGSVTMTARSETAAKHAFALGQTTAAPPTPSVTGSVLVSTPGAAAWALAGGVAASASGTMIPVLTLTGAADTTGIDAILIAYRLSAVNGGQPGAWQQVAVQDPGLTSLVISGVQDQTSYDVSVTYRRNSNLGGTLILGPAVAGQTSVPWQTGVTGTGKPADNATNTADPSAAFGSDGKTIADVIAQLNDVASNPNYDTTPPGSPTGLAFTSALAADGSVDVTLTWNANSESDLASYDLNLSNNGGAYVSFPTTTNGYVVHGLQPNQAFKAKVRALDRAGNPSPFSAEVTGTTTKDTTPPAAPTALAATASARSIFLTWKCPPDTDVAAIQVWEGTSNASGSATLIATINALPNVSGGFTRSGLTTGGTRYYWVKAVDTSGNVSVFSSGASATPAQLTDADLQAIAAAKLTGQITTTQITDGGITTPKIAVGAVSTASLAAGAVTTDILAANSVVAGKLATGAVTADSVQAGTLTGDKFSTTTSLPGTITVGNTGVTLQTIQQNNQDPAAAVNANTTLINPGRISLTGGTTLTSWLYGGDNTKINGGAIAANTVTANVVSIGLRGISTPGITFDTDRATKVTWTAGVVQYVDDSGNQAQVTINAGSGTWSSSASNREMFVYFDRSYSASNNVLLPNQSATRAAILANPNNIILACYRGGTDLNSDFGKTIVDGDYIKTGTVNANRLLANSITAAQIQAGTIVASLLAANSVTTDKILAGTIKASHFITDQGVDLAAIVPGSLVWRTQGSRTWGTNDNLPPGNFSGPWGGTGVVYYNNHTLTGYIDVSIKCVRSGNTTTGDPYYASADIYLGYQQGGNWSYINIGSIQAVGARTVSARVSFSTVLSIVGNVQFGFGLYANNDDQNPSPATNVYMMGTWTASVNGIFSK